MRSNTVTMHLLLWVIVAAVVWIGNHLFTQIRFTQQRPAHRHESEEVLR